MPTNTNYNTLEPHNQYLMQINNYFKKVQANTPSFSQKYRQEVIIIKEITKLISHHFHFITIITSVQVSLNNKHNHLHTSTHIQIIMYESFHIIHMHVML